MNVGDLGKIMLQFVSQPVWLFCLYISTEILGEPSAYDAQWILLENSEVSNLL